MSILVIAEHDNLELKGATLNAVTAAQLLGEVDVLVAGAECGGVAASAAKISGIGRVRLADDETLRHPLAELLTPLVVGLAGDYSHILAPATTFGKNLMPRVAALLDVAQISDVIAIESADRFQRPIYAGNAIATVESSDPVKIITVRTTAFAAAEESGTPVEIDAVDIPPAGQTSKFVDTELSRSERPELTAARVVISGGRGMQNGENFVLLERVADTIGAAVGASRAAVDSGFVSNDYQVGQTGKIVAPDLYIAVGISGAIQHLAGMKDSKVIVAINKDEEAPIFQVADYGLVADLFEALPELADALEKLDR